MIELGDSSWCKVEKPQSEWWGRQQDEDTGSSTARVNKHTFRKGEAVFSDCLTRISSQLAIAMIALDERRTGLLSTIKADTCLKVPLFSSFAYTAK